MECWACVFAGGAERMGAVGQGRESAASAAREKEQRAKRKRWRDCRGCLRGSKRCVQTAELGGVREWGLRRSRLLGAAPWRSLQRAGGASDDDAFIAARAAESPLTGTRSEAGSHPRRSSARTFVGAAATSGAAGARNRWTSRRSGWGDAAETTDKGKRCASCPEGVADAAIISESTMLLDEGGLPRKRACAHIAALAASAGEVVSTLERGAGPLGAADGIRGIGNASELCVVSMSFARFSPATLPGVCASVSTPLPASPSFALPLA